MSESARLPKQHVKKAIRLEKDNVKEFSHSVLENVKKTNLLVKLFYYPIIVNVA